MDTQVVVLLVCLVGSHLGSARVSFEYVNPTANVPYIQEGDIFELKCKGAGQSLNWFHGENSRKLTTDMSGSGDLEVIENVKTSGSVRTVLKTITWRNVPLNATGKFTCKEEPSGDTLVHDIFVIKVTTPDVALSNQTSIMLECNIVGLKETVFQGVTWSKDGTELVVKDSTKYTAEELFTNATLTINNIGRDDGGAYTCGVSIKVSDEAIQFSSTAEVYRKIEVDPFFKSASKNLIEEEQLKLKCKIFGHKVASVSWLLDNKPLAASDRVSFSKTKFDNDTLTVTKLQETDKGDYSCNVLDSMGNLANATVLIRVKDKYAALWPFLGICAEVAILCLIIFIYEKRRSKQMEEEDQDAAAKEDLLNSHGQKSEEVRKRNK